MLNNNSIPTFDEFRTTWLENADIRENLSPTEKGRRFAEKIMKDWLDVDEASIASDNFFYCDGAGDGGIDIAYLQNGTAYDGDTWYLVQSKYGNAFKGTPSLLTEARKILDTLDTNSENRSKRISTLTLGVLERLEKFYCEADPEQDKIVLLFATDDDLSTNEKKTVDDIRAMGRRRLGNIFDVQPISIRTIYRNLTQKDNSQSVCVSLRVPGLLSDQKLNAGLVSLTDLYTFLESYRAITGDINRLYEKNVRQFLTRSRVNPGIKKTLNEHPELFGLYNNGITLVVNDIHTKEQDIIELVNPYVVNGCQTTQTIWNVFDSQYNSGGTGNKETTEAWKQRAAQGAVITKIVKISVEDETILENITRFTNKQNAVAEKDFLALDDDFQKWKQDMEEKYNIFLEVQRGGWDAHQSLQRRSGLKSKKTNFADHANAFDLIKVYGAGWLGKPGEAWNSNSAFLPPHGEVFKQLIEDNTSDAFGVDDLYAAYRIHKIASEKYEFGRIGLKQSKHKQRGPTRFLFYMIVIQFLRVALSQAETDITDRKLTQACLTLFRLENKETLFALLDFAVNVIDGYMNTSFDNEFSIEKEPNYTNAQSYLRHTKLGTTESSPRLNELLNLEKLNFKRGEKSACSHVVSALRKGDK